MQRGLDMGTGRDRILVLLPGFITPARSYAALVAPLVASDPGLRVVVPQMYRIGPSVLMGRYSVAQEASEAVGLVRGLARMGAPVWLVGHSRGGQAAWLAAGALAGRDRPAGLVLIDPVAGSGPRSAAARLPGYSDECLVIGAGIGSRCAPAALNHEQFAAAAQRRIHATVQECGHADVLAGPALHWGRWLCAGGPDPQRARATVTALIAAHLRGELEPHLVVPGAGVDRPRLARDDRWPSAVVWN